MARPSKVEERKEQILDAFERCVVQSGIQGATLDKVAKEAGLPRSPVRNLIGNRDDMLAAVFERFMLRVEALWSGLSWRQVASVAERFLSILSAHRDQASAAQRFEVAQEPPRRDRPDLLLQREALLPGVDDRQ